MTPDDRYCEAAVRFDCAGETLLGVLAAPVSPTPCHRVGVVIVVGGPQVRIGSHRQFVALARRLAAEGHAVLRYDVRGMGDSTGAARGFEALQDDIGAGIDALLRTPGVERAVLWGLCDGASASLLYAQAAGDARLAGLALLNPWVRSEQSLAQTHVRHYYLARLLQPGFWRKLLGGGVGLAALRDLLRNLAAARGRRAAPALRSYQQRMADGWTAHSGRLLVLLSQDDWTAKEFDQQFREGADWAAARAHPPAHWHWIAQADHTLSDGPARRAVEDLTLAWLRGLA